MAGAYGVLLIEKEGALDGKRFNGEPAVPV